MRETLYFVYYGTDDEIRMTNESNLDKCVEMYKHDHDLTEVYVSEATMCFDGYWVKGDYIGKH